MGYSADYCMSQQVSAFGSKNGAVGVAMKVSRLKCDRWQCPYCAGKKSAEAVFKAATKLWLYSLHTGEFPAALSASIHPDYYNEQYLTWKDYGNANRRIYKRLEKLGIDAYFRMFHPYRVQDDIKRQLHQEGYGKNGEKGGYWKGVRDDALGLASDKKHGKHQQSLHHNGYVDLSPHLHVLAFPSYIKENTDRDIVIKKYATLDTVNDLVNHLKYIITHTVTSNDFKMESKSFGGILYKWKAEDHFTPEQINLVKKHVADAMGLYYDAERDELGYEGEGEADEGENSYEWTSIHELASYSPEHVYVAEQYFKKIRNPTYRRFIERIVDHLNILLIAPIPSSHKFVNYDAFKDKIPAGMDVVFVGDSD